MFRTVLPFAVLLLAACGSSEATRDPAPRDAGRTSVASDAGLAAGQGDGQKLYAQLCAVCHGPEAKGYAADNAPSLVNPTFLASATDDFLRRSIEQGRPGTAMAPYGKAAGGPLDTAQVNELVTWIRSKGPEAKVATAAPAGDASRGAAIYAEKCASCHGTEDTRGAAIHLANRVFLSMASDGFLAHAIREGRPGTAMEPFAKQLSEPQIGDVVAFLRAWDRGESVAAVDAGVAADPDKTPVVINPKGKKPEFTLREGRFVSSAQVAKALADKRRMVIIDARPRSEWLRVRIPGAVSIPHHAPDRLGEVPADAYVIAYCACPHHLSGEIVDMLKQRGHGDAAVLDEGILFWHREGHPVEGTQAHIPPPKVQPGHEGHAH